MSGLVTLPVRAVLSADRWRRTRTGSSAAVVRRLVGSAAENAGRALEEISRSVQDRERLLVAPDEAGAADLVALDARTCGELLGSRSVGRLAYVARAGVPDIVPVNYLLRDGDLLIRSGPGPKLQAAERRELVAFEVDDLDEQSQAGWSVVVLGRADRLPAAQADALDLPHPWAHGPRRHVLRIRPVRTTGRRVL